MTLEKVPIGLGSKVESSKETLPAVEVKNHVLYVNEHLHSPLNLTVGEPTNLAVFLTQHPDGERKSRDVEVKARHGRSALLGRFIFEDKGEDGERQVFRDVDIKGLGYIDVRENPSQPSVQDIKPQDSSARNRVWGILNSEDAFRDKETSEMLRGYGVRTHRVVAIVGLGEIIFEGNPVPVEEAKSRGLLPQGADPVLEIRAFGTHARFMDVFPSNSYAELNDDRSSKAKRDLLIEDARVLVAQELGKDPSQFTSEEYYKWLAGAVGKNVGLLHKHGWAHNYLADGHNITLDGRLVDFESARRVGPGSTEAFSRDDSGAFISLQKLLSASEFRYPMYSQLVAEILKEYEIAYEKNKS